MQAYQNAISQVHALRFKKITTLALLSPQQKGYCCINDHQYPYL